MTEDDGKFLHFIISVIQVLLTISLIGLIGRFLIWLVCAIIEACGTHSENKAIKRIVKLFYKWRIKKEDLSVKEVKKLKKALDIAGLKRNATMEDLKNAQYRIYDGQPDLAIGDVIYHLPTLKECGVKVN